MCKCVTFLLGLASGRLWQDVKEGGERGQSIRSPSSSYMATVLVAPPLMAPRTTSSGDTIATQEGNHFSPSQVQVLLTLCWFPHLPIFAHPCIHLSSAPHLELPNFLLESYLLLSHLHCGAQHDPIHTHLRQNSDLARSASLWASCMVSGLVLLWKQ